MAKIGNRKENYSPNDTILTPKWVFEELGITFDVDVAHPEFETHVPCKRWYTEQNDGLKSEWSGVIWLNPPYSNPTPWIDKFIEHANGIALVPMAKSKWFNKLWDSKAIHYALPAQFKFEDINGKPKSIFSLCSLWAMGEESTLALTRLAKGNIR